MKIYKDQTFTEILFIDGEDVLITNCTFTHKGGVFALNHTNLIIQYSDFHDIDGAGIVLRSSGQSMGTTIRQNDFSSISASAILAKVGNYFVDINHNAMINCGYNDKEHPIYAMSPDASITDNWINGTKGNGISIRTSGYVARNTIEGAGGSAIKYFADGVPGPSDLLTIEDNECNGSGAGESVICLRAGGGPLVGGYVVRGNKVTAYGNEREFEAGPEFRGLVEYER